MFFTQQNIKHAITKAFQFPWSISLLHLAWLENIQNTFRKMDFVRKTDLLPISL